ncbi:MAG: NERD domain-containing protein [Oceanospirillaceae bacterium]|nr:NERD domain-containing protein [Oceanospirillaceae bacterium]
MEWLSSFYAIGIVLLLCLGPLMLLVGIAVYLKKLQARSRTTPLRADLLRPAGFTLQKQIDELQSDLMLCFITIPVMTTLTPLLLLMQEHFFDKKSNLTTWVMLSCIAGIAVGYYIWKALKIVKQLGHLRLGYACEMAVGQELEQIVRPDERPYRVFHDIPFESFNVDHLIVTPSGVFVIETKGRSKPINSGNKQFKVRLEGDALHFPNHVERAPLEQTRRNVQSVRKWLCDATGFDVPVSGILVLPGWYIERKQRSVDPFVMNATELTKQLPKLHAGALEAGQVKAVAHQVTQRVRDVDRERVL